MHYLKQSASQLKHLIHALALAAGLVTLGYTVFASNSSEPLSVYRTIDSGKFGFFGLCWSPDSQKVAVAGSGGSPPEQNITIWDVTSGQPLKVLKPTGLNEDSPMFLPDQSHLLAPPFNDPSGFHNGPTAFSIWDITRGVVTNTIPGPFPDDNFRNYPDYSTISADRSVVAEESQSGLDVTLYSTSDLKMLRHILLLLHPARTALALSSDGRYIAIGPRDGAIDIYDVASGTKLRSIEVSAHGMFGALAFSPDSKYLASSADTSGTSFPEPGRRSTAPEPDHAVTIWNVNDGSRFASYPLQRAHNVEQISWSPNGEYVIFAAWGDQTIRLWNPSTPDNEGIVLRYRASRLDNPKSYISPNGKYLAVHTGSTIFILLMPGFKRSVK
jgi:WD40 repeat protein